MKNQSILISGASVAGPALAYWLRHHGFTPTIVERAPAIREGGHAIDLRGVALRVAERMDLLERVRAARTNMRGMSIVDADGAELVRNTEETLTGGHKELDSVELMRDDLVRMLFDATRGDVEYVFDDSITALAQHDEGVRVSFARGAPRAFDLVVGADGLHSNVRALVFGEESRFVHHLGQHLAVFGAENFLGLDHWQVFHFGADKMVGAYSARGNAELRIMLGWGSEPLSLHHRDVAGQKAYLAARFAGMGWEMPRLLDAMERAPDLYFDSMSQVQMPAWSKERTVLVGDAACAPSPLSGQGTSLAFVGAYVLAEELAATRGDHATAFAEYERRMRPFVQVNQALAHESIATKAPPSRESVERAIHAIDLVRAA